MLLEDRQCTYNVTIRRVRATIVAVGKATIITYCVYNFSYPACSAHVP